MDSRCEFVGKILGSQSKDDQTLKLIKKDVELQKWTLTLTVVGLALLVIKRR